jgi:hypothetical protein
MQKKMARMLLYKADQVAEMFSNKERGGNVLSETYEVEDISVLSEVTAAVTFIKRPTGKKAVAWFYYINSRKKPRWEYFFVTYSHLVGLEMVGEILHEVEQHNFSKSTREESA